MSPGLVLRFVLLFGLQGALLFGGAGRLTVAAFWAYLGLLAVAMVVVVATIDRDLLRERVSPGAGGTDRGLRAMIMPFSVVALLVAGLDGRWGWSRVAAGVQIGSFAAIAMAFGLVMWAMRVNRFFSPVVRIQSERGHRLVTGGPYGVIRHPGYLAAVVWFAALGPALGSWWAMIPAAGGVALMVRRVIIEDRYLREHLEGYGAYAGRVQYRFVPGVW